MHWFLLLTSNIFIFLKNVNIVYYSHYLNVTLWGDLAECFHQEVSSSAFEEPLIIIIAAGKVGIFQGMRHR